MSVFEKVKKIICQVLKVEEDKVTLESHLVNDLGADSLDAVDIIMSIEDEYGVQVSDEAATSIKTVGDLVKAIEEATK